MRYCSKECQREDWSDHKAMCKLFRDAAAAGRARECRENGTDAVTDGRTYLNTIAPKMPEAKALAREIGLKLLPNTYK